MGSQSIYIYRLNKNNERVPEGCPGSYRFQFWLVQSSPPIIQKHMSDIIKSIQNLDSFTDGMEQKVDGILKAQEKEFVNAYKQHMIKIKEDFKKLETGMLNI